MAYERKEISIENIRAQEAICARIREMLTARVGQPLAMVDTYGCQQNEADSEKLRGYLAEMGCGFTQDEFSADIIVVNTCAVREHAEMRVLGNVGQLNHSKKVAELGSITKAADVMGYTQSAVSRMIADLEDEWNLNLLRRNRGGLSLSSDGVMLLPYIKEMCSRFESLQEQANALKGLETGFIRIGSCSSFSTQCLPAILKEFELRYPKIIFQLQNMEYSDTEDALCAGEIDCGFISAPFSPDLDVTMLMRDRMLAVLPPDHPLVDAKVYPMEHLSQERIVRLTEESNNEVSKIYESFKDLISSPLSTYCEVNDDYSVMAMVESGLGVSMLSELVTKRMPFNICLKEFDPPQYRDIGVAVKKGRRPSPATERFIEVVLEFFEDNKYKIPNQ